MKTLVKKVTIEHACGWSQQFHGDNYGTLELLADDALDAHLQVCDFKGDFSW